MGKINERWIIGEGKKKISWNSIFIFIQSYYLAPEIIKGKYDERCDIWSAGVILYVLVTSIPPFDGADDEAIIEEVAKGNYSMDIP